MAEGEIPPLGSWRAVAFIEGPLVEEIGQFLGRVVPVSRGVDAIARVLPLPALQAMLRKTDTATQEQMKEDGKRVIKVHTAIDIVQSWLSGIGGTVQELADLTQNFIPPIANERTSLLQRIAQDIRNNALQQGKKKYILKRSPNKQGQNKGFASDWTRRRVGDKHKQIFYPPDPGYPKPVDLSNFR